MTKSSKVVKRGRGWFELTLPFPPTPASRPNFQRNRKGVYYGKTYRAYRAAADKAIPQSTQRPFTGNLKATIEFVCRKPKTTKRQCPVGDIDNHMKAVLDSITGKKNNLKGYWNDDDQITEVYALKRWQQPGEEPHTRIKVETI